MWTSIVPKHFVFMQGISQKEVANTATLRRDGALNWRIMYGGVGVVGCHLIGHRSTWHCLIDSDQRYGPNRPWVLP